MPKVRSWVVGLCLFLAAGCAGGPAPPSAQPNNQAQPQIAQVSAFDYSSSVFGLLGVEPEQLWKLVQQNPQQARQRSDPETALGLWVSENGVTRSWLRLEKPRLRVVTVVKEQSGFTLLEGDYATAVGGLVFGVMTRMERSECSPEQALALWNGDESALARLPATKVRRAEPFSFSLALLGDDLAFQELAGNGFGDGRDRLFRGRFQQVSLGRPAYAHGASPLGRWQLTPAEIKGRIILSLLPERLDVLIEDQVTGRRLRLAGPHRLAGSDLVYGVFDTLEQSNLGAAPISKVLEPQVFCFRFAWNGPAIEIKELHAVCLGETACKSLCGVYRPGK
jgi:hypothetical protein